MAGAREHHGEVEIIVDGVPIRCRAGESLLRLLRSQAIDVPCPCFREGSARRPRCRLCLVEIEGRDEPVSCCEEAVVAGMVVRTASPEIDAARRENLRRLFEAHYRAEMCAECIWHGECELHLLARRWRVRVGSAG